MSTSAADRYGVLLASYWIGETGREIQAKGAAPVILGAYLGSTHHANMIGLYTLPLLYVAHDLPVLGGVEHVRNALGALADVGYAFFDERVDLVWVVEMARVRLSLAHGEPLRADDKRHGAVVRMYQAARPSLLVDRFYQRYASQLGLDPPRQGAPKPPSSPIEGASKPLASSSEARTEQNRSGSGSGIRTAVECERVHSEADQVLEPEQSTKPHPVTSRSVPSREGTRVDDDAPLDAWYRELLACYPAECVTTGYRTESAFSEQFRCDARPAADVWAEMRANLDNQRNGYRWRVKRMIPKLHTWLSDGLWHQQHQAMPADALTDTTRANAAALDAILRKGRDS